MGKKRILQERVVVNRAAGARRAAASSRIAFQGERGAFSEQAVHQLLGARWSLLPCRSFEEMFEAVVRGRALACVVPIENTLAGSIHKNFDLLLRHQLQILAETNVRIEHHLIALPETRLNDIREITSHPAALDQCQAFLRRHPRWEVVTGYDTAGSVKSLVQQHLSKSAAIAGSLAARFYKCKILRKNIEDHRQNFTRFWLLSKSPREQLPMTLRKELGGTRNKTSIVFSTKSIPGALFKCLSVFALRDINLSKIESRPLVGRPFEYLFYVDFLGNIDEKRCQNALRHLGEITDFLRVLGCYREG
ncbi:MAG: prephenate dehydratase [Acidobacteriia bacterium]|nr:prephenate dehydratase [Terriglobia bacterium]